MEIKTKIEEGMRRFLMVFMLGVLLGVLGCRVEDSMLEGEGEGFGGVGVGVVDIASVSDFEKIRRNPAGDFRITKRINFEGSRFRPIPNFTGTLDGVSENNYLINLTQNSSMTDNLGGIFGTINGEVKNLYIRSFKVQGRNKVGLLGGTLRASGNLTNINVQAFGGNSSLVAGNEDVGGLVGVSLGGYIGYSRVSVNINATGDNVGGLVGRLGASSMSPTEKVNIEKSQANMIMVNSTGDNVGGLVGANYTGNIDGSIVNGEVVGNTNVGGMVGYMISSVQSKKLELTNGSIFSLTVQGDSSVGGFIGGGSYVTASNLSGGEGVLKALSSRAGSNAGGIAGKLSYLDVNKSSFYGQIEGFSRGIGGVVGYMEQGGTITRSSGSGTINLSFNSNNGVGGVIGISENTSIIDCASGMDINLPADQSQSTLIGGLVGSMTSPQSAGTKIENSYFSSHVEGNASTTTVSIGSLVGKFGVPGSGTFSIKNSYVIKGNSPFGFVGEGSFSKDKESGEITRKELNKLIADKKVGPNTR